MCCAQTAARGVVTHGVVTHGVVTAGKLALLACEIALRTLPGHPKPRRNRRRDALAAPRRVQMCARSVSERPQGVPGAAKDSPGSHQERPGAFKMWPGSTQKRAEATIIDAKVASRSKNIEFFSRGAFTKHRRTDFPSLFVNFRVFLYEPSEVLRLPAKTEVGPSALLVELLAPHELEKR